jgi:predicted  nucleic acid-binding Zn-ribbon protein
MHEWVEKLLAVQDRDLRIEKLEEQIQSVPEHKAQAEKLLKESEEAVAAARKAVQDEEKALHSLETQVDSIEAKKRDFQSKSTMIKNNEEYKAALHQIERCTFQISQLEDKELELMEQIEEARQELARKKKEHEATKDRVANMISDLETRLANSNVQVAKLREGRDEALHGIEPDIVTRYDRLRSSRLAQRGDGRALVAVRDDVCDRCRMNVTAQVRNDARKGIPVSCQNCGALLYHE